MQELDLENNSIWIDIQNLYEKYALEIEEIKQRYRLNIEKTFNIFCVISDQYQKENLHSDIIRAIIGQDSDCFKSEYIMKEFLKFIGVEPEDFFDKLFNSNDASEIDIVKLFEDGNQ